VEVVGLKIDPRLSSWFELLVPVRRADTAIRRQPKAPVARVLKQLPEDERQWVADECKRVAVEELLRAFEGSPGVRVFVHGVVLSELTDDVVRDWDEWFGKA
jgi:hypothetical protein